MTARNPKTIENLFAALEVAVFEQLPGGLFQPVGSLPDWLRLSGEPVDLTEHFPLLELFLAECESTWVGQSDVWTEPDASGGELYLQAVAATAGGRRFLALKSLPQALFTYQQLAHDFELQKEKVERLSRELDLKRREAESATQAKSQFLATMSHEIRTPLNAIIGMADVLSGTSLTAEQQKCVDVFQRNGLSLLNLINDILDLSKVESGKVELESAGMDLREVIARALEVIEVRSSAKGLSLRQTIAPGVAFFRTGDPNRLRQIIINLLGNSIKFTEKGGLEVRVEPDPEHEDPDYVRFGVSDTGIGIPPDKLDLVFESFSQADSSTTRKYGGTGLGLAISKQLVELMEGRIWVESQVGAGSTFFFTARIPVEANQTRTETRSANISTVRAPTELESIVAGMRILLADDSEDNRYLILSYLRKSRCAVDIAENGESAVQLFRSGCYDLILMDVEMPVMDGFEATREIRRIESDAGLNPMPVLALTAHAFTEMAAKGREAGFTALLTKPIRKITLLEALIQYGSPGQNTPETKVHVQFVPERNRIQVEEGMEDVVPAYLEKRRAEVPLYYRALAAGDFDAICGLAHKMKGTGSGYGFPLLTELGGAMEKAALASDTACLQESLQRLALFLESVELEYIR